MSKTYFTIIFSLMTAVFSASGQQYKDTHDPSDEEIKSLLSKKNDLNAFGAADLKVADLKDERGLIVGAYGGFIINRRYMLGVAGYGLVTNIEFDGVVPGQVNPKKLNLHGGYGGILIGGSIAPRELIHLSIPVLLGAGAWQVVDKDFFIKNPADSEFTIEKSVFFVIEPGIEVEVNVTKNFRLGAGVTYRYISGTQLENLADEELSGTTGMISFRFGRF